MRGFFVKAVQTRHSIGPQLTFTLGVIINKDISMTKQNILEIVVKTFGLYCLIQIIRSAPGVLSAITLDQSEFVTNQAFYASLMALYPLLHLILAYIFLKKSNIVLKMFGSGKSDSSLSTAELNEEQPIYAKLSFWITIIGLYYFVSSASIVVSRIGTLAIKLGEGMYLAHDPLLPQAFIFILSLLFIFRSENVANFIKNKSKKHLTNG